MLLVVGTALLCTGLGVGVLGGAVGYFATAVNISSLASQIIFLSVGGSAIAVSPLLVESSLISHKLLQENISLESMSNKPLPEACEYLSPVPIRRLCAVFENPDNGELLYFARVSSCPPEANKENNTETLQSTVFERDSDNPELYMIFPLGSCPAT